MCDVTAYLVTNGSEEMMLENVDVVEETAAHEAGQYFRRGEAP